MRSFDPRAMVIVLGVLVAGPVWASPAKDSPPSGPIQSPWTSPNARCRLFRRTIGFLKRRKTAAAGRCTCQSPASRWSNTTSRKASHAGAAAPRTDTSKRPRPAIRKSSGRSSTPTTSRRSSLRRNRRPDRFPQIHSGDPEGRELLAILIEVLDAGSSMSTSARRRRSIIWPYFARYPVGKLTAARSSSFSS